MVQTLRTFAVILVLTSARQPLAAQDNADAPRQDSTIAVEPIPLPQDWSTFYVVLLGEGDRFSVDLPAAELQELMGNHIQYQLRLQRDGVAIASGGFGQDDDGLIGLTLLRVSSLEEAQRIANADPAVQAKRFEATVREWWVPAGRLD